MVVKQALPITHFEKWLPLINVLDPDFWKRSTAVVAPLAKYYTDYKNVAKMFRAKNNETKEAFAAFLKMFLPMLDDIVNLIEGDNDSNTEIAKELKEKGINLEKLRDMKDKDRKKYTREVMDYLYICRIGGTITDEGILDVNFDQADWGDKDYVSNMMTRMYKSFYYFNKYGRKQFRIEEQLTAELLLTGVGGVYASFLKFPYPAFSISIPHNKLLTVRRKLIHQAYINEVISLNGAEVKRKITITFIFAENHIDNISFLLDNDKNLLEQVEEQISEKYQSELAKREMKEMMSFLLATILYMNSKDVVKQDITPSAIIKTNSKFPCCALGYGIPVNQAMHITRADYKSDRTINVLKFTVRGHFRTYNKGEHWKQDQVIWIKPFLKGTERENPDMSIKPSIYKLKNKTDDKSNNG